MPLAPWSWIYIGIALVFVRRFAGWVWRQELEDRKSSAWHEEEISPFGCFMIGMLGAAIWPPLIFAVIACTKTYDRWPDAVMRVFFYEPSRDRRERQLKRRREEIERLEKELEIA